MTALNLAVAPVVHTSPKAPCSPAAATATTPTAVAAECTLIGHQPTRLCVVAMGKSKSNTTELARETAAIVAAVAAAAVTATPGTIETAACTSGATGVVDAAGVAAAVGAAAVVGAAVVAGMTRAEAKATLAAETAITACTLIGHQPAGLSPMAMEKSKRKTIKFAIETAEIAEIAATATAVKTTPGTIEVVEPLALEGVMSNGHGGAGNNLSAVVETAAAITGGDRDSVVESFVASKTRKKGRNRGKRKGPGHQRKHADASLSNRGL
jgi:hypothetical protein